MFDVIGFMVILLIRCCLPNDEGPALPPPKYFFLELPLAVKDCSIWLDAVDPQQQLKMRWTISWRFHRMFSVEIFRWKFFESRLTFDWVIILRLCESSFNVDAKPRRPSWTPSWIAQLQQPVGKVVYLEIVAEGLTYSTRYSNLLQQAGHSFHQKGGFCPLGNV